MDKNTVIQVTVGEIEELLAIIDYEYELAKFCKDKYLQNPNNFDDEERRRMFAIRTDGRLTTMKRITAKLTRTSIMRRLYSE